MYGSGTALSLKAWKLSYHDLLSLGSGTALSLKAWELSYHDLLSLGCSEIAVLNNALRSENQDKNDMSMNLFR